MKQFFSAFILLIASQSSYALEFIDTPACQTFIEHMSSQHGFNRKELKNLFKKAHPQPKVLTFIAKPFEEVPWFQYESRFLGKKRIDEGVEFWKKHAKVLSNVQRRYGVPAEIIVAIIGVETFYGRTKGTHPVFESLSTLAFQYPPRAKFFTRELEAYLLMAREAGFDPLSLQGSYAGALGTPQFMPSSYRHYAVRYQGKGSCNLMACDEDAIASVANYFRKHGWKKGQGVICPVKPARHSKTDYRNPKPAITLEDAKQLGFIPQQTQCLEGQKLLSLLSFQRQDASFDYWLGLPNFYVITRYNHSIHYGMAVYQLSLRLKDRMHP